MRIDLHLHTKLSKENGDSISWESDYTSLSILKKNNVRMAAFTDHDCFDAKQFIRLSKLAKTGDIVLLPGIEVCVRKENGKIGHMLIIFREDLLDNELEEIEKISKTLFKDGVSIHKINDLYKNFDTIRIIHVGKDHNFTYKEVDGLNFDAIETTSLENKDYLSFTKNYNLTSVVSFSDTHMWDHYPQWKKLITIINDLKTPSFSDLKKALSLQKVFSVRNE